MVFDFRKFEDYIRIIISTSEEIGRIEETLYRYNLLRQDNPEYYTSERERLLSNKLKSFIAKRAFYMNLIFPSYNKEEEERIVSESGRIAYLSRKLLSSPISESKHVSDKLSAVLDEYDILVMNYKEEEVSELQRYDELEDLRRMYTVNQIKQMIEYAYPRFSETSEISEKSIEVGKDIIKGTLDEKQNPKLDTPVVRQLLCQLQNSPRQKTACRKVGNNCKSCQYSYYKPEI